MIEIKSITFNKNPCEVNEQISLSVDIYYEEDKYLVPTYYKILTSEQENMTVTFDAVQIAILSESGVELLTENDNTIITENS